MSIPKRLLIHTVTIKQQKGIDRDRNPVYEDSELQNVRVGVSRRVRAGQHGAVRSDAMTLFIDARHSVSVKDGARLPLILPKENDALIFEGREYCVKGITPCYARGAGVHHYEAVLE